MAIGHFLCLGILVLGIFFALIVLFHLVQLADRLRVRVLLVLLKAFLIFQLLLILFLRPFGFFFVIFGRLGFRILRLGPFLVCCLGVWLLGRLVILGSFFDGSFGILFRFFLGRFGVLLWFCMN